MSQSKEHKYVYLKTGVAYELCTIPTSKPSQYPSSFFRNKNKPVATLSTAGYTEQNFMNIVMYGVINKKIDLNTVKYYLWKYFKNIKVKLTEEWKSYEVVIGKKDQEICPWDIVSIETNEEIVGDLKELKTNTTSMEQWIACLFMISMRLSRVNNQSYEDSLSDRILDELKVMGYNLPTLPPKNFYNYWVLDPSYCKMISAIDMFLYKFPKLPASSMRICSLSTRYRDCDGLLSLRYICNLLNLEKESQFSDWLWTERLVGEVIQMIKPGEEYGSEFSYFPYQSDMGLVRKTYYSSVKNPHLHFIIHAVGTLLQSTRSKNAKLLTDCYVLNNIRNAQVIAFAFSSTVQLSKASTSNTTLPPVKDNIVSAQIKPEIFDGTLWALYAKACNFKLTEEMRNFVQNAKDNLGEVRKGTIGEFVKNDY